MDPHILMFLGLAVVLTITPGADTALVTKNTLSHGRPAALATTLGISTGLMVHATMSGLGLSAILNESALAFEIVKWIGAAYLVFIGLRSLFGKGHLAAAHAEPPTEVGSGRQVWRRAYTQGLLTNVLNPKVALFYLTLLPQFMVPGDPVLLKSLLLAGIHITLGLIWLSTYAYFLSRLSDLLMQPTVRQRLERVTGLLLLALGVRLAWEHR
jgi:RhtB (resistance to homoserine/threonine) family protein